MKKNLRSLSVEETKIWESFVENVSVNAQKTCLSTEKKNISNLVLPKKQLEINSRGLKKESQNISSTILIDKKVYLKLKNGRLNPERTLDLHGLNYEKARLRVESFIKGAYEDQKRLILIITGKGVEDEEDSTILNYAPRGILRRALPNWLDGKPLNYLILNFTSAHFTHGGNGAYYVYLRRKKL